MKPQLLAVLPLVLFLALLALVAVPLLSGKDPAKLDSVMIGRAVPDFTAEPALPDAKGLARTDMLGAPAVINFFASWCVPCQAEQPLLTRLAVETGVAVYGVNYKDKPAALAPWLEKHGNPFRAIGSDADGRIAIEWGVYGVPETFVVDAQGVIRLRHVGPLTEDDLDKTFRPVLEALVK